MGWQVGFRWGGEYYCFVVLVEDSEEAVRRARAEAMIREDAIVTNLTCISARGCVYKA